MTPKTVTVESSDVILDGWPTKQEAADRLGVSTKTVEKYVAQGRLAQRMQSQINKPARAVIDPDGLRRMVEEREHLSRMSEQVENTQVALSERSQNGLSLTPEAVRELFAPRELPPSELAHKLYLTEDEAVRYTGLGRGYLREAGKWRLIGERGARVYRRVELEEL